ncbi:MAG: tetratricopeptide repeat protein [Pirellulales bacterium]|nr:tetratricopeptide repeat protein [Pirellulales bacterium]
MKSRLSLLVVVLLLLAGPATAVVAQGPPSYEEARLSAWILNTQLLENLGKGDATQSPGTHAWLKDFRAQTQGIDKDTPVAKWPKVDVGKLIDHNPNFWRMYFEIAPGDPLLTMIQASLLLSQGEARRAAYLLELGQYWPGIPKRMVRTFQSVHFMAMVSLKASSDMTQEGIKLFDQGDYDGAIKKYHEALKLCPQNGWTSYELGYALRTKAQVARGEPLDKPGTLKTNGPLNDPPEVTAAFADARLHDPLQFMAYQGTDQEVIKGFVALVKKVKPAWDILRKPGATKQAEYYALKDLSEGFQEAGVHDLAILARQLMAARRNSYAPEDYPIFVTSLRKLAPGKDTERLLSRLGGAETIAFRTLIPQEPVEGQPALGSGQRVFMPNKPSKLVPQKGPVRLEHLVLITNEKEIADRATVEDLVKFSKDFQTLAKKALAKSKKPCKVFVHFTCTPLGHTVKIGHRPEDVDREPLQALHEAITKMNKLPVKEESVEFQFELSVAPEKGALAEKE